MMGFVVFSLVALADVDTADADNVLLCTTCGAEVYEAVGHKKKKKKKKKKPR